MRALALLLVAGAALATGATGAAGSSTEPGGPASRWVATDLGKLPRDRWLAVADINDRGQVVGEGSRGFIWENGRMTGLAMRIEPATTLVRQAINERGQIIGTSRQHAVLWENGRMIDLGQGQGRPDAINERGQILGGWGRYIWQDGKVRKLGFSAAAINNRGQVVGAISVASGGTRAVMWQKGRITDLGPPWQKGKITTLGDGYPVDINDRGDVLGQRLEATGLRVILWRNGTEIDLGPGSPAAINERGQVTGFTNTPTGGFAFLWQNGRMTDLGTLGGSRVFPTAISNRGQVVGWSLDESGVQHAFLWQSGTMTELGSPKGTTGPDAFRTRAIAINEHNQIIGDNCIADCGGVRGGRYRSKFAVIWTLKRG
jgi:probable HAF family extracellular repeat protein